MAYRVEFTPAAHRQFRKLSLEVQRQLAPAAPAVDALAEDPRPVSARKLSGVELWRMRVGDYRVIYALDDPFSSVVSYGWSTIIP